MSKWFMKPNNLVTNVTTILANKETYCHEKFSPFYPGKEGLFKLHKQ